MTKTVRGKIGIGVIAVTAAAVAVMLLSAACGGERKNERKAGETKTAQTETVANVETSSTQCSADDIHGAWDFKKMTRVGNDGIEIPENPQDHPPYVIILSDNSAIFGTYGSNIATVEKVGDCEYKITTAGGFDDEGRYGVSNATHTLRYNIDDGLLAVTLDQQWGHVGVIFYLEKDREMSMEEATRRVRDFEKMVADAIERARVETAEEDAHLDTDFFTDPRDNQTYRTVRIGNRTWMAHNLKFAVNDSWCYDKDDDKCEIYGRLYTLKAAMDGACPAGWRLPGNSDWFDLVNAAGGADVAGGKLRARYNWNNNGNGSDDFGFTALPGGYSTLIRDIASERIGMSGYWWSSEVGSYFTMDYSHTGAFLAGGGTENIRVKAYSVRCVMD